MSPTLILALIAVLLTGAGVWWGVKTLLRVMADFADIDLFPMMGPCSSCGDLSALEDEDLQVVPIPVEVPHV